MSAPRSADFPFMTSPVMPALGVSSESSTSGLTTILAGMSHALDLTEGHPRGHAERTCRIAQSLARVTGLDDQARRDLVHATLLKDAGCSSNAQRVYEMFGGPEHGVKRAVWERDWRKFGEQLRYALQWAERGGSPVRRFRKLASIAVSGQHGAREIFQIRCARGAEIARRIGCAEHIAQGIHDMDEHWDGGGHPRGLRGDEIPVFSRIMGLSQVMEIFWGLGGPTAAIGVARARCGTWFEPALVRAAETLATDTSLWEDLFAPDLSSRILRQTPDEPVTAVADARLDQVAAAFALIIDGKSPYTFDHSARVADYAVSIGRQLALGEDELRRVRRAGLVHDLGKLTVPNSILEHPGKLDEDQWRVVRQHPSFTFDVLSRVPMLEELAFDAASHHERMDGRGYHLGLPGERLSLTARILAVADVMDALAADRPYRGGMEPERVLGILTTDAGTHFCPSCVDACSTDLIATPAASAA
jgi:HD-GYP domain-containing protein (c-di-GMP phosphodiesterase class II)